MILTKKSIQYFQSINSRVLKSMAKHQSKTPFHYEDEIFFAQYECLRSIWKSELPIKNACQKHNISKSSYYEIEKRFIANGLPGLFSFSNSCQQHLDLEQLALLIKKARPQLSYTSIHRIAQVVPITESFSSRSLISRILQSHGYGISDMKDDINFWGKIQRTLDIWANLIEKPIGKRCSKKRKTTFLIDADVYHKRIELLRHLFYHPDTVPKEICFRFGISMPTYYRLIADYKTFGIWAVIASHSPGKQSLSPELQLSIIIDKLKHPEWSPELIIKAHKLKVSRHAVYRVITRWGLNDKSRNPIALDEYLSKEHFSEKESPFKPLKSACHLQSDETILATRRINRHFDLICNKMKIHPFQICDPGPFILAPFVNDLGVVQAFNTYGPVKLRGKEITNLALLNIFRILSGYRRISHLNSNSDRSVALASGIGMYGSTSKYYEDTVNFTFEQLHKLRCDLVARAKELGLIEGLHIGFDFHFKEFYGKHSSEKNLGKGPDKAGNMVPGFRPHIAWDLATNVIINIAYFQGGTRAPRIIHQFCEQNILPVLDPLALKELYIDSEYTKETDFHYYTDITFKNSEVFVSLRKNKQILKLINPAIENNQGWKKYNDEDDYKSIQVKLPKTGLEMKIVILRDRKDKSIKKIRCFGTTNLKLSSKDILRKYRFRWVIENGIKDLVGSYFIDEIFGLDPVKVEFEFYCVMVARLAYEYFLKELGGQYYNKVDGNKYTLQTMRNLLFEKRNCNIEQDLSGNFILTFLEGETDVNGIANDISRMLMSLKEKNKVLWWRNRSIF
ncbi:MAG: transposase [Candidatus Magnetoglobus multicellularis str. Araruama]|uniref:Transposase n=1 Tax=Candidatus Magnetoglobus multicellularis str. Araruama TaxID=890399 RepID=A0A1V1NYR6_9BACT|nr:MAG: transposase [Candidatus Magnetoglobus multicellularis str. Araruama]